MQEKINELNHIMGQKIGVFDGGVGGMLAFSKIRERMPEASIVYVGDCRNLPYNTRPREWIRGRAQKMIDFLQEKEIETLVIACHTVSSMLNSLDTGSLSVYEIVNPTLEYLQKQEESQHYLFIGTSTTIDSGCYKAPWLEPQSSYLKAIELATRIEREGKNHPETKAYLGKILGEHFMTLPKNIDSITVVLVCTHYFLVQAHIEQWIKENTSCKQVEVVEPSLLLAEKVPLVANEEKGEIEIFLNQDQTSAFQKKLDKIYQSLRLKGLPTSFVKNLDK